MNELDTRETILYHAINLISGIGYEAMTMRMLAQSAKVQTSTLYYYFDSKEMLLEGVLDFIREHLALTPPHLPRNAEQIIRSESPQEILRRFSFYNNPTDSALLMRMYRLLYTEQYNSEAVRAITGDFFFNRPQLNLVTTLQYLEEFRSIAPGDHEAAAFVWWRTSLMYCFLCTHYYLDEHCDEYDRMCDFLAGAIIRGVRPLAGGSVPFVGQLEEKPLHDHRDPAYTTRERILFATFKLLDAYGSDTISVRMISEAVGIKPGSLYNHFKGKDEIVEEVCKLVTHRGDDTAPDGEEIKRAVRTGDRDALIRAISACNAPLDNPLHLKGYRMMFREQYRVKAMRDYYWGRIDRDIQIIADSLNALAEEGTIRRSGGFYLVAKAYIFTMASIHIGSTMFEDHLAQCNQMRDLAGRWLLGLVLN